MSFLFVTGGCRSGKSAHAQKEAEKLFKNGQGLYIATAYCLDQEMLQRVELHKKARGPRWQTFECEPGGEAVLHLALPGLADGSDVVLFDSLTLWVSAWMESFHGANADEPFIEDCTALLSALRSLPCPVFLVSDETGMGLVPENRLARRFRDLLGLANQKAAAMADSCVFMVSGLPMRLKSETF